jgi:hypothetical protein
MGAWEGRKVGGWVDGLMDGWVGGRMDRQRDMRIHMCSTRHKEDDVVLILVSAAFRRQYSCKLCHY